MRVLVLSIINIIDTLHSDEENVLDLSYISDAESSSHLYKLIVDTK